MRRYWSDYYWYGGAMAQSVNNNNNRLPALDGVRGLAILLVLFHHLVMAAGIDRKVWIDGQFFDLAYSSWLGVDLFFVLSGFLITGILFDAKGSDRFFRSFYGRRVLRIFPLYYASVVFAVLLFPILFPGGAGQEVADSRGWFLLFVSNVKVAMYGWPEEPLIDHFWSLAVEEQFYLLWPLAVWSLGRRQLMYVAAACFFGALALRFVIPSTLASYVLLPTRMDTLAAGALLALLIRGEKGLDVLGPWPLRLTVVAGTGLGALMIAYGLRLNFHEPLVGTLGYTIIALTFAGLIGILLTPTRVGRFLVPIFSHKSLTFMGKYSFGLYVVHPPIIAGLVAANLHADLFPRFWGSSIPGALAFSVVGGVLSVACAFAIYHVWEKPFLQLKKHLPYRKDDATIRDSESGRLPGRPA